MVVKENKEGVEVRKEQEQEQEQEMEWAAKGEREEVEEKVKEGRCAEAERNGG